MLYLKHPPVAPLARHVEYLWLVADAPAHARERILPTGTLELVFDLHSDEIRIDVEADRCRRLSGAVLSGAYTRPFVIDTTVHALMVGVHFRPGGAASFLRVAPGDLADAHHDAGAVTRVHGAAVRERLARAPTHGERFRVLEQALLAAMVESTDAKRPALALAVSQLAWPGVSVRDVVAQAGLSHRHFVTVFRDVVGMAPKTFSRIHRFQRALSRVHPGVPDWARIACECGYADQAHLVREFAALSGSTPRDVMRRRGAGLKDHHLTAG